MKPTMMAAACAAAVFSLIVFASGSYGRRGATSSDRSPELAAFTDQGIPLERARQALALQQRVTETHFAEQVEVALRDAYAGVWFEPTASKFHVGVTSNRNARVVRRLAVRAGFSTDVVATPVRSTWAALIHVQERLNHRFPRLLAVGIVAIGINVPLNAVSLTLSSSATDQERTFWEREAKASSANVMVNVAPPQQPRPVPQAECESPFTRGSAFCGPTLVAGAGITTPFLGCTAGPMLIEGNQTYMLTSGHCFSNEITEGEGFLELRVESAYPRVAGQKKIGELVVLC